MSRALRVLAWLVVLVAALLLPQFTDSNRVLTIAIQTFVLGALASSWNILGGFAGQISLGHAAFFGAGALTTRELWLGGQNIVVSVVVAVLVTAAGAAIVGVPMLRFRGIYFSIGTLALGVGVFITTGNLRPGISSLPVEQLRSYTFSGPFYFALLVVGVAAVGSMWLRRSKIGLGMLAVREDEEAAGSSGVNVLGHKLTAFVLSAAIAGLAGAAFAVFSVSYYPQFPFGVVWTFEAILVVFIGGIGTVAGPLIGSVFFIVGRDTLASNFEDLQVVLFGVLFIVVVLLLPGGIVEGGQRLVKLVSRTGTGAIPQKGRASDE